MIGRDDGRSSFNSTSKELAIAATCGDGRETALRKRADCRPRSDLRWSIIPRGMLEIKAPTQNDAPATSHQQIL
jgi:hypothetical protein